MLVVMGAGWVLVLVFALFAVTAAVIRYLWSFQREWAPGLRMQRLVACLFWGATAAACFFMPLASMPPNIGFLFSVMIVALLIHAVVLRRREFARALNNAVLTVCAYGGSLPDVLRGLAWGKPYLTAGRVRLYCIALDRGADPVDAARGLLLPLEIDALLALQHRGEAAERGETGEAVWTPEHEEGEWETRPTDLWPAGSQVAYLVSLLFAGTAIAFFMLTFIVPTFNEMFEEFGIDSPVNRVGGEMGWNLMWPVLVLVLLATLAFVVMTILLWLTDYRWIARCVPLIGPLLQSTRRANCLRGLARMIESGREASSALASASQLEMRLGQRMRLRRASELVGSGVALAPALGRAGVIDRSAEPWVDAAEANQRLPAAFRTLAETMTRRARLRYDRWMSVLFPLGVMLVGLFVLWLAWWVIGALAELVHALA